MKERGGSGSRIEPRLAWAACALAVIVLISGAIWESGAGHEGDGSFFEDLALFVALVAFPVVGSLVVGRPERNPLGWLLIAIGLFGGVVVFSATYAQEGLKPGVDALPGATFAAWLANWTWYPTIQLIFPLLILLFPTGRVLSPRWRPVLWLSLVCLAITTVLPMFDERLTNGGTGGDTYTVDNPIGIPGIEDAETMMGPLWIVLAFCAALASVSLILRFRRSRGVERMQLKWFTLAAVALVASIPLEELLGASGILFSIGIIGLPISLGIAILRYRLYEIDVIINRALVYGLLTGLAVVVYLGLVFALQLALEPVTEQNDLAVAASTLAVAALIGPLRSRIQRFIDRRFYRRKYDSSRALADFATRLRDEVDLRTVQSDVLGVLTDTLQPTHASLWLPRETSSR